MFGVLFREHSRSGTTRPRAWYREKPGVLAALAPGLRLPIADVLYLSTAISDNTAANLLIAQVGVAAVNARLARLGLTTTRLSGRIFVEGERGEQSPSTAAELVTLLRCIHRHDGLPARACDRVIALLERTQTASTIGRGLPDERFPGVGPIPPEITLAYKTGSIEGVVAEAAIVRAPRATYAIAVLSAGSNDLRPNHDNIARVKLGEVSRAAYETFTRPWFRFPSLVPAVAHSAGTASATSACAGAGGGATTGFSSTAQLRSRSSATSICLILSSRLCDLRPSVSIVMQNGQALATVFAPVSTSWSVRFTFTRFWFCSSIHICAPPAPQQRPRVLFQ
jgi:hypothetical protein